MHSDFPEPPAVHQWPAPCSKQEATLGSRSSALPILRAWTVGDSGFMANSDVVSLRGPRPQLHSAGLAHVLESRQTKQPYADPLSPLLTHIPLTEGFQESFRQFQIKFFFFLLEFHLKYFSLSIQDHAEITCE